MDKIKVSEMFLSLQGEGIYTGRNTAWIRLFNCNLNCDGFFQKDPTKPETYDLPYKDIDVNRITMVEDLPVFEKGCDSSYSWAKKFRHLIPEYTPEEIADKLEELVDGDFFEYDFDSNHIKDTHLCFTGGEPLLKPNQHHIIAILKELEKRNNLPKHITIETNCTVELCDEFVEMLEEYTNYHEIEILASCSPKLFNVSGEPHKRAWKHDVARQYYNEFGNISYKFVMNNREESWQELDEYISLMQHKSSNIYIMPVGATVEQQSQKVISEIANKALKRGFHVSGRLHCYIFGNGIGK